MLRPQAKVKLSAAYRPTISMSVPLSHRMRPTMCKSVQTLTRLNCNAKYTMYATERVMATVHAGSVRLDKIWPATVQRFGVSIKGRSTVSIYGSGFVMSASGDLVTRIETESGPRTMRPSIRQRTDSAPASKKSMSARSRASEQTSDGSGDVNAVNGASALRVRQTQPIRPGNIGDC